MEKQIIHKWTEGVCGDGAAILRDGVQITITDLLKTLNDWERCREGISDDFVSIIEQITESNSEYGVDHNSYGAGYDNGFRAALQQALDYFEKG